MSGDSQSEEAPAVQSSGSVFDFLYYDHRRVGSLISQFDNFGHLTGITLSESASSGKSSSDNRKLKGSVPGLAGGEFGSSQTEKEDESERSTREYDPLWANALAFLDYLQERDLLAKDLENARIGNLVLHVGNLSLMDTGLLEKLWALDSVKKQAVKAANEAADQADQVAGNRQDRRRSKKKSSGKSQATIEAEMAVDILGVMPHLVHAAVTEDTTSVWCSLNREFLSVPAADLIFKHGLTLGEGWGIVGILDAFPEASVDVPETENLRNAEYAVIDQLLAGSRLSQISYAMGTHLVTTIRGFLGRPDLSYGITPLLIFREVRK